MEIVWKKFEYGRVDGTLTRSPLETERSWKSIFEKFGSTRIKEKVEKKTKFSVFNEIKNGDPL